MITVLRVSNGLAMPANGLVWRLQAPRVRRHPIAAMPAPARAPARTNSRRTAVAHAHIEVRVLQRVPEGRGGAAQAANASEGHARRRR